MLFIYATQLICRRSPLMNPTRQTTADCLRTPRNKRKRSNSSIVRLVVSSMNQSSVAGAITVQNTSRLGTASLYEGLSFSIYPFLLTCSECSITNSQCTDPREMDVPSPTSERRL